MGVVIQLLGAWFIGMAGQLSGALLLLYKSLRSTSLQREELAAQTAANLYALCVDRITDADIGKVLNVWQKRVCFIGCIKKHVYTCIHVQVVGEDKNGFV